MDTLASVGAQLAFFALSMALMRLALRARNPGGLFGALPLGLLPALILASGQFWSMQQPALPEVAAQRAQWTSITQGLVAEQLPDKDQAPERAELTQAYSQAVEALPAGQFCLIMIVLAPLAAFLRRRRVKRGLAPDPGPLGRWCAPWGLVWLVLGPSFWWMASRHGLVDQVDWVDHLALNVFVVGAMIFLFQSLVVVGAWISAMARNPRTRSLALLFLAGLLLAFFLADSSGTLPIFGVVLMVGGLLEPWLDFRRIHAPPPPPPSGA
ncbi:MAG TPA: hypothetical protein VK914_12695 [bacterium]|jgi:hypothetical protein|nr:hypothetical protein [bacterium]